ncbi:MAG: GNAT family N-acetyltransferase [Xanthobacteraceae bacterium]|nr:GNAT family N-acetyltransferase [Xanthobacteraceae bacterium]
MGNGSRPRGARCAPATARQACRERARAGRAPRGRGGAARACAELSCRGWPSAPARRCLRSRRDADAGGRRGGARHGAGRGGRIAGYAVLCFGYTVEYGGRDAFVDDIYVAPELRGRGHGAALYAALEAAARASGCRALHLEVMPDNAMRGWYEGLGYRDRGSAMLSKRL